MTRLWTIGYERLLPEALVAELRAAPPPVFPGRPTKKSRRDYEKWLYSQEDE